MAEISYRRHRFPPIVIQHAVWLYLRFTLSYRDVEELLAERGLDISYESVRSWVLKFGPMIARRLRQVRPRPSDRWASRRDGRRDRGQADVSMARRRSRRRDPRRLGSAPARPARGRQAHAQADAKAGVRAKKGGHG